jgi:fimbrial chaperone protein
MRDGHAGRRAARSSKLPAIRRRGISVMLGMALTALAMLVAAAGLARAQGITVLPVTVQMAPGQMSAALTVANQTQQDVSFQIRPFVWTQANGQDKLSPTTDLLASPPISTIPAGQSQVMRLVLRVPPRGAEATYRILLDQIPAPAAGGTVRIALRLSIPIFAEPDGRLGADVHWHVESGGGQLYLVGVNNGQRHDTIRNIDLAMQDARLLKVVSHAPPYILAGASHRWLIQSAGSSLPPGTTLRLTARADSGPISQPVRVEPSR